MNTLKLAKLRQRIKNTERTIEFLRREAKRLAAEGAANGSEDGKDPGILRCTIEILEDELQHAVMEMECHVGPAAESISEGGVS